MKGWSTIVASLAIFAGVPIEALAQKTVILVRHAELEGAAMAEPKHMALSTAGEERAKRLADLLKDAGINAIYVTDFARTNKTAEPLYRKLNMQPVVLPKGDPRELAERVRKQHANETVLMVGHTDTLPGLIKALGHPEDIKIDSQDYSNLFVLVPKSEGAPTFLRIRY